MLLHAHRLSLACLFLFLAAIAPSAFGQWAWRDSSGHPVYSDVPPPPNTPASAILRRPTIQGAPESSDSAAQGASNGPTPAAAAPPSAPAGGAASHAPTVAEQEQAFRKRMKERADAERKHSDDQAQAAREAESCERARGYMRALEDGVRLVRTNPDGTRDSLDESQRAGEVERTRQAIHDTCK